MLIKAMKEGVVLVRPLPEENKSVIIFTEGDEAKVFHRGVVQSMGCTSPMHTGFIEGDTILYSDPLRYAGGDVLVSVENIIILETANVNPRGTFLAT